MELNNKSYDEILKELLKITNSVIPQFTNYKNTDPLVILHQLISSLYISSNQYLSKYLNSEYMQKSFMIDRKSMYLLLEKFDMTPRRVIPSTIDVVFEYINEVSDDEVSPEDEELEESVLIPAGTKFLVKDTEFTILEDYYIKINNSYINIRIIEGQYRVESFYKSNIYNNRLILDSNNVADNYIKLLVDNEEFSKIESAQYSDDSKVFSIELDINGNFNIVFSDKTILDINESSTIVVKYIESTGSNNYDPMSDSIVIDSKIFYNGRDVHTKVVQGMVTGYLIGDSYHTESNNYNKISSVFPTFRKIVTIWDYKNLTNYYPGVAISASYDSNDDRALSPELNIRSDNLVKVIVAPREGYYITDALKNNLYNYYRDVGLSSEEVCVEILNPTYILINLTIGVSTIVENQAELLNIYNSIENTIEDYFKIGNIDFQSLIESDNIASLVFKVSPRIDYADILEFKDSEGNYYTNYQLNAVELPILCNLNILFSYKKIVVVDNFSITDTIALRDITYYLQGSRGDQFNISDNSELRHELEDSGFNFNEKRYFGYFSEFTTKLSQDNSIIISDYNNSYQRESFSKSSISSIYGNSLTDDRSVRDDLLDTVVNSLVLDREGNLDINYDY